MVTADEATGTIATHEHGGVLRAWDHTLQVEPLGPGRSRYRDTVRIDAGRLTPLVATLAVGIYRYRERGGGPWRAATWRCHPRGADPTCTGGVPGV